MNSRNVRSSRNRRNCGLTYSRKTKQAVTNTPDNCGNLEIFEVERTAGISMSSDSLSRVFASDFSPYSAASYGLHMGAYSFLPSTVHYSGGDSAMNRMFANPRVSSRPQNSPVTETEDADDEEELERADTYSDYMPSKLKIGHRHPEPVVETSSLSSVAPPDIWYKLLLPDAVIDSGLLSALQLEAITYACQQHETILPNGERAGFLIGDGAGVGKGRTIAGIIFENILRGRKKAIWLSVSSDLKYDAERDLNDIGAGQIEVHSLNKLKYADISSKTNKNIKEGIIFATYPSLVSESQSNARCKTRIGQLIQWCGEDFDGVIVFDECHRAKNLCPVASGKATKTGFKVLELQTQLPKARVVYASATGASEPRNMAYMTRLGLWGQGTPFKEFGDFVSVIERRGVGAMELVAMDMKLRGLYIARQLSFSGVSFRVEEIPLTDDFIEMYNDAVRLWVHAREKFGEALETMQVESFSRKNVWAQFWASHQRFFKYLCVASKVKHVVRLTREAVKNGNSVVIGLQSTGEARTLEQLEEQDGELTDFVSSAKGVFQSLIEKNFPSPDLEKFSRILRRGTSSTEDIEATPSCSSSVMSAPTDPCSSTRRRSRTSYGDCVPLDESDEENPVAEDSSDYEPSDVNSDVESESASSTDSSDFNPFGNESDSDNEPWASRARKGTKRKNKNEGARRVKKSKTQVNAPSVSAASMERAMSLKEELMWMLNQMADKLPPNTLDYMIDELGGPENVAEMTGRKGRVVSGDGPTHYESRSTTDCPLEKLNMVEKQRFMDGEKHVAIISAAASSGISLHSDRRSKNQSRRVHMTLELPWSAEGAIQQFGRTHRSNQANAPEYIFLISDLAGERRFASVVAKRLESLGALTHGDRRATETRDLSMFNFDTKYGRLALETMMQAVMEYRSPLVPRPADYLGDFFYDLRHALCGVGIVNLDPRTFAFVLDKDYNRIDRFLNRILGIEVRLQNELFKYFTDTLDAIIAQVKKTGRYDVGILDLGSVDNKVNRVKFEIFVTRHISGTTKTVLHTVQVERGTDWDSAVRKLSELSDKDEGFYISIQTRNGKKTVVLTVLDDAQLRTDDNASKIFRIYRPNTGLQARRESLAELKSKYRKTSMSEVQEHWLANYDASKCQCSHEYWYGQCRRRMLNMKCEVGLRQRTYYVLSGSVLAVWADVEKVMSADGWRDSRLRVVRLKTQDDERIVGCLIPEYAVDQVMNILRSGRPNTEESI